MKALILAAGLGTRLMPYTGHTPKPLFPIDGRPVLDRIIRQLESSGCTAVAVNTHYKAERIQQYLAGQTYAMPVFTVWEPEILGTGGAILNLREFWDKDPFWVVNADIVTDIDFSAVYSFHIQSGSDVTLVLVDYPEVNTVRINPDGRVQEFLRQGTDSFKKNGTWLTFTGIQVIHPNALSAAPPEPAFSSIELYQNLIRQNGKISAWIAPNRSWMDIGSPERYHRTARDHLVQRAFYQVFGRKPSEPLEHIRLEGDGSDRIWERVVSGKNTLILADHGIRRHAFGTEEVDSFIAIGGHLHARGVSVPKQIIAAPFSGIVVMEDVGDVHLQTHILGIQGEAGIEAAYVPVIRELARFTHLGYQDFDPAWTYQTSHYDETLILERECGYFLDAFVQGYLNMEEIHGIRNEFEWISGETMKYAVPGLIHRDMQSRNIMMYHGRPWLIDFQGARFGPIQYDLASLLIDPYVRLPIPVQEHLLDVYHQEQHPSGYDRRFFDIGFRFCQLTRNLQILGAFGFLARVKHKPRFQNYMEPALWSLAATLERFFPNRLPLLTRTVSLAKQQFQEVHHGTDKQTGDHSGRRNVQRS